MSLPQDGSRPAPRLVVSDLCAGYGTMEVVSRVSLDVAAGETVALIGRNGAGKSTLLMAIAGLRYGSFAGSVLFDGRDLSRASAKQAVEAGIAHVPEGHRVFTQLTVAENLRLGAYRRRRAARSELDASLGRVFELFPVLRKYARREAGLLSGGEQQMVAIGQGLMVDPKILMLDEPTSGLALPVVQLILDVISELRAKGLGILIVEQSVTRALAVSDRCYLMERGLIVIHGDSAGLAMDERIPNIVRGTATMTGGG
jgi:branched-chain amino acid transport system ATP-binding protein